MLLSNLGCLKYNGHIVLVSVRANNRETDVHTGSSMEWRS